MKQRSKALAKAQERYYRASKDKYMAVYVRFDRDKDADLVAVLEAQDSKQGFIKEAIRAAI